MKIVFFGSAHFGVPSLRALVTAGHRLSCVVTQPDRKKGRGLVLSPTLIKQVAEEMHCPVFQPERINAKESVSYLTGLDADVFVVIAYGQLLSRTVLDIPRIMPINIHASLLPKYRGAAPINWAIMQGEDKTGISAMRMVRRMDAGPVLAQRELSLQSEDTAVTIEEKLSAMSAELLLETLTRVENGTYRETPQDETGVTYAPKLNKEMAFLDWNRSAVQLLHVIRGTVPWPVAFTCFHSKMIKFWHARLAADSVPATSCPGQILKLSKDGILVATGQGSLLIDTVQVEGKRIMSAEEFLSGHTISLGDRFGAA